MGAYRGSNEDMTVFFDLVTQLQRTGSMECLANFDSGKIFDFALTILIPIPVPRISLLRLVSHVSEIFLRKPK